MIILPFLNFSSTPLDRLRTHRPCHYFLHSVKFYLSLNRRLDVSNCCRHHLVENECSQPTAFIRFGRGISEEITVQMFPGRLVFNVYICKPDANCTSIFHFISLKQLASHPLANPFLKVLFGPKKGTQLMDFDSLDRWNHFDSVNRSEDLQVASFRSYKSGKNRIYTNNIVTLPTFNNNYVILWICYFSARWNKR